MGEPLTLIKTNIMFSIVFIVALIALANAHNWVNSPSRSVQANTVSPALPSSTGQPHVQVIAGQPFQIEWVQGHGRDVWFTFVAAADHKKMSLHTSKYMDAYLDEAGATKSAIPAKYEKYHRKFKTTSLENGGTNGYFKRHVPKTDPNYITRDATFKGSFSGAKPRNRPAPEDVSQFQYPDDCKKDDRRSFHKSANAPHIIGMHRYRICVHNPSRPDVALFEFPKGTKPGKYIVHYRWSGYYDAIDVQIVAGNTPTKNPYGLPVPPGAPPKLAKFKRIDHCEFLKPEFIGPCARIIADNVRTCLWQCSRLTGFQCSGVNVVHYKNPDTVYPAFRNITNIHYDDGVSNPKCRKTEMEKTPTSRRSTRPAGNACPSRRSPRRRPKTRPRKSRRRFSLATKANRCQSRASTSPNRTRSNAGTRRWHAPRACAATASTAATKVRASARKTAAVATSRA